jgi:hypothetical protein
MMMMNVHSKYLQSSHKWKRINPPGPGLCHPLAKENQIAKLSISVYVEDEF